MNFAHKTLTVKAALNKAAILESDDGTCRMKLHYDWPNARVGSIYKVFICEQPINFEVRSYAGPDYDPIIDNCPHCGLAFAAEQRTVFMGTRFHKHCAEAIERDLNALDTGPDTR